MEDINTLYFKLRNTVKTVSGFEYTEEVAQKIKELPVEYREAILSIVYFHYINEYTGNKLSGYSDKDQEELKKKIVVLTGKKSIIYSLPYGGKTYEKGKGIKYNNLDDNAKFPEILKKIITAYINMISL
jgi:hypothetical protein